MSAFHFIRVAKRDGNGCAVCDNIAPCPTCSKGLECQQIFRSSCQTCPVNKCVQVSASSGSGGSSSSLGGALGGVLAAVAIAAVLFFLWRRNKKRRIALADDARERSDSANAEKNRQEKDGVTLHLGTGGEVLDQDTEWTQVSGNPIESTDSLGQLQEPTVFKRRSFGAATHLSRITEGAEEEEEEETSASANGPRISRVSRDNESVSNASSIHVGSGPRISVGSGTSFGSKNIIPISFRPSPDSGNSPISITPSLPPPAHRASGAPHVVVTSAVPPPSGNAPSKPMRPTRAPELNLRLADGAEPGQANSSARNTLSPNASAHSGTFDFMSIDPAAVLNDSRVYSKSDRHLSTATVNTMASTSTAGLDYVLSAPQIVTPVTADGARRVQLNKGGKAQLVRGGSLKRTGSSSGSTPSLTSRPLNDDASQRDSVDPFADAAAASSLQAPDVLSSKASHNSTWTLGIPFADGTPTVAVPEHASPIDADRSSWLGSQHSVDEGPFSDDAAPSSAGLSFDRRSSRTESIGGLSVFDQFPITLDDATFPSDAKARIRSVTEKSAAGGWRTEGLPEEEELVRDDLKR